MENFSLQFLFFPTPTPMVERKNTDTHTHKNLLLFCALNNGQHPRCLFISSISEKKTRRWRFIRIFTSSCRFSFTASNSTFHDWIFDAPSRVRHSENWRTWWLGNTPEKEIRNATFYIPRAQWPLYLKVNPSKIRPFPIKTRVIWVLCRSELTSRVFSRKREDDSTMPC